jgi:hypothetical protein
MPFAFPHGGLLIACGVVQILAACTASVEQEVVPGVPNDAQICELNQSQVRAYCEYWLRRSDGQTGTPLTCTDGEDGPAVVDAETCVGGINAECDILGERCQRPAGPNAHCFGSVVDRCVHGRSEASDAEEYWCNVGAPQDCTVTRPPDRPST